MQYDLTPTRLYAIDSAKGIGIALVVFGHAWRGAQSAGLIADGLLFRAVDSAVYAFHMPLFFFLSGLLFLEAMQSRSAKALLTGRLTRLLWPMALWSWIFFSLKLAAGAQANNPVALSDFPIVPLPPYEHLWFLWALFLCHSMLILAYALPPRAPRSSAVRVGAGAVAAIIALLNPLFAAPSLLWGPMVEHIPYFLAGITAGGLLTWRPSTIIGAGCALGFAVLLWAVQGENASVLHSLALVGLGWVAWLGVDGGRAGGLALPLLRKLGQVSMVIYLTHTIFSAALRIVMLRLGWDGLVEVLLATTLAGLALPFVALWVARRLRLVKLLGF